MKKIYLFVLPAFFFTTASFAQPGAVGNNNISGAPFVCTPLTAPSGFFFQARILANQSSASATWEFPQNCSYPGDVWRPYFGSGVTFNSTVVPAPGPGDGALYNSANGGASGTLPATTNGNYYTFNIQNVAAPTNAYMAVLETNYNPVTISAVSNTTPANASNSVLVNCTASSAPASGEYVYVRYSTDGYVTSALAQFSFTGTAGQALIPCFAGGTVVNYYVMSSNRTAAQIAADVLASGSQVSYDMLTLNLNNNGGTNYSYTQGSATNFGGIYSTPSTCYATVSAFVTALNGGTVTAPVTMYAIGGSPTETATAGGISITQTGTLANPIVLQKFGTGSYTIQASAALTAGILHDAIFELVGSDYITIDGFTLQENATNTNTTAATNNMTEWGIALLKSSATDGAQNNTIQNNTISLDKTYRNTFGIYSNTRHTTTAVTTTVDATAISGTNSNNKVYANTISNVMMGITFIGTSASAFHDSGNDIGGNSAATGNTLTNWGGNSAVSGYVSNSGISYCIFLNHQVNDNVSYNNLNSGSQGSGVSLAFEAIRKDYTTSAPTGTITTTISHNTITMTSAFTGGNFTGIRNQGMTTLATATINITNNNFLNTAVTAAGSTSSFGGIINSSACGTLNITNNIIRGHTSVSSGGYTGITNGGAVVNTINITDNKVGDVFAGALTQTTATGSQINAVTNTGGTATATVNLNNNSIDGFSVVTYGQILFIYNNASTGVAVNMNNNQLGTATGSLITFSGAQTSQLLPIFNGAGTSTATLSMQHNDIRGIVHSVPGSNTEQYMTSSVAVLTGTMSNNTFTNISTNTTGQVVLMRRNGAMASGASWTCSNNSIVTGFSKTGAGNTVYGYFSPGSSVNGSTMTETGNNFSNVSVTGGTTLILWNNEDGASVTNGPTKVITGNTFNNITGGSSPVTVFRLGFGAATNCSNNTMTNITGTGDITGIFNDLNDGQGTVNYSNNTMSNFSSTGTGGNVTGITGSYPSVPTTNINGNTLTGFSSTGANAGIVGINSINGQTINIYDNLIDNFSGSGLVAPTIFGIVVSGGVGVNVFRNRIHTLALTGAISAGSSGVHGMFLNGGNVTVHNNFIANLTAPAASLNNAIMGIGIFSATAATSFNLYYNSIYINATSIGTNFFTSGIYHLTNATATTGALTMTNNIIVNTSTATGTGVTAAYRRSDATLTNFASSDHNLLYAGTPSATRLIFYDGTNSDQTLAAYQARVSPKDANSISLMPTFTSATDLHLTSANCRIDGKATPLGFVTTDIDLNARDVSMPDIGADEFTAAAITTLAGVAGVAVCDDRNMPGSGTTFISNACGMIATVVPSGASPVTSQVSACVTLDATQQIFNGDPYVQRHFDIEPAVSPSTSTATITLYFTDAEFVQYNSNNPVWPPLPTAGAGNTVANRNNVKVTQFHGAATTSPSSPGNYPGVRELITPGAANVVWNGIYWAVTFDVTGFSGFYVHTNNWNAPLPIVVNYLTGRKQGSGHLLNWKVTCTSTPRASMTLERSSDAVNYSGLYTITADAARCQQPFDYTDTDPLKGMNYYRLKIVDADGKVTYSTTVALLNAVKGFDMVSIAPNPVVTDNFKLNVASALAGKMEIHIFDMQGRLVNRRTLSLIAGFNSMPVNVANLAPGTYTIKGSMADDRSEVLRFVKQ
jgi:Secretion system C-terminal sorting domain